MEKQGRMYCSFEEADKADAALTPQERLQILIELRNQRYPDAAEQRMQRVVRIINLRDKA